MMSWSSKQACGVAAAGAIQGFRLFRDEESSITFNFSHVAKLLPPSLCSNSLAVAAAALQSASSSASQLNMILHLQDKEVENISSSKKKAQFKEESLRTVMYLSCWAPN